MRTTGKVIEYYSYESHHDDFDRKTSVGFPLEWCRREGLERGGPLNVFDLGDAGLLLRPVKPPPAKEVAALLAQTPAGRHSKKQVRAIVARALREVRAG